MKLTAPGLKRWQLKAVYKDYLKYFHHGNHFSISTGTPHIHWREPSAVLLQLVTVTAEQRGSWHVTRLQSGRMQIVPV